MATRSAPVKPKPERNAITFRLLVHIAWRNLVSKKLRTFLTIFGIVVGIGSIFFLISFGLGLQNLVTKQVIGDRSIKAIDAVSPNSKLLKLDSSVASKISRLGHVDRVSKTYNAPGSLSYKGSDLDTVTYGIDTYFFDLNSMTIVAGRYLDTAKPDEIVISRPIARSLNLKDAASAIGKEVVLTIPLQSLEARENQVKKTVKIVGVTEASSGTEIYISGGVFEGAGVPRYSQLKVIADDTANVSPLRRQIEALGLQTTSPIDTLEQINQVFRFFTLALVGFGFIGMIIAVLGMFNTLTVSLLERTKEIGLMFALGARRGDVYQLFILEAVILSIAGAAVGIVNGVLLGYIINFAMNQFAAGRGVAERFDLFSTPWWLIGGTLAFMVVVGLLVVIFPARRARNINPIDALRRE